MNRTAALVITMLVIAAQAWSGAWQAPGVNRIPKAVMDALIARFPGALIEKWTLEKEDGRELYDIEFRQKRRKMEADIFSDGALHNWEREVAVKDLPAAVVKTIERRYPGATLTEAMAVTAVTAGKEALEGYEVALETADKRDVEVTVAPGGTILEDSGGKK